MYVKFKDRSYASIRPYRLGEEVNGTDALNGTYETYAHILGFELRKTF
jgi:long-chain fatty acid transport protein